MLIHHVCVCVPLPAEALSRHSPTDTQPRLDASITSMVALGYQYSACHEHQLSKSSLSEY